MIRGECLTLITECIELFNSSNDSANDKNKDKYEDKLNRLTKMLNITVNDQKKRDILSGSLSLWDKINEIIYIQIQYQEMEINNNQLNEKNDDLYRVRIIRGIIIISMNLIIGLKNLFNYSKDEFNKLYINNDLNHNNEFSIDLLFSSIFMNNQKNVLKLIYYNLILIEKNDTDNENEIYKKLIISSLQFLININNKFNSKFDDINNTYEISEFNSISKKIKKLSFNESNENQLINYYFLLFINNLCLKEYNLNKIFIIKFENIELHLNLIELLKDDDDYDYDHIINYKNFKQEENKNLINFLQIKENIIKLIILNKNFYNQFIINLLNDSEYLIIEGYFKLIYDLINNNINNEEESFINKNELKFLLNENYKIFKFNLIKEIKNLIEKSNNLFNDKDIIRLENLNNLLVINLEIIYELIKYLNAVNDTELLIDIIEFFRIVEKNIRKVRLKDLEEEKEPPKFEDLSLEDDSNKDLNKGLNKNKKKLRNVRGVLIDVITVFVYGNFNNQELVRENHGLEAVLNSCNIDHNEPFIKEKAVLCLKFLLMNNEKNQAFVRQLEPQRLDMKPEDEAALARQGYAVDIVDGKVKLDRTK